MATQSDISVVFQLNSTKELFNAPSSNPFSSHEVDILGQSAMDCMANRVTRHWPRKTGSVRVTIQLPAEQITPDLAANTRTAIQRYCDDQIETNQLQRRLVVRSSRRQFWGAMVGFVFALIFIALLVMNPFEFLPDFVRWILCVLAFFAGAVLTFDALWAIVFDWVPFAQDTATYQALREMELSVETLSGA